MAGSKFHSGVTVGSAGAEFLRHGVRHAVECIGCSACGCMARLKRYSGSYRYCSAADYNQYDDLLAPSQLESKGRTAIEGEAGTESGNEGSLPSESSGPNNVDGIPGVLIHSATSNLHCQEPVQNWFLTRRSPAAVPCTRDTKS